LPKLRRVEASDLLAVSIMTDHAIRDAVQSSEIALVVHDLIGSSLP
jgi:RNase P/RNase MRP subunit p30